MIERWRAQRSFGDGLIAAEVANLYEAWMRRVDRVLDDPQIVAAVYVAKPGSSLAGGFDANSASAA